MAIEIKGRGYPLIVRALTDSTITLEYNGGGENIFINSSGVLSAVSLSGTISTTTSATEVLGPTTFSATAFSATTVKATTVTATTQSAVNLRATTVTATTLSGVNVAATQVTASVLSGSAGSTSFLFIPGGSATNGAQVTSASSFLTVRNAAVTMYVPVFNSITASA